MRAAAGSARRSRPRHLDAIGELRVLDPGTVHETRQLTGLLPPADRPDPENVLNGIACDAAGDRLFVTGKRWPKLLRIRVVVR